MSQIFREPGACADDIIRQSAAAARAALLSHSSILSMLL